VKALREGRANIAEIYAATEGREIVLVNANIPNTGRPTLQPRAAPAAQTAAASQGDRQAAGRRAARRLHAHPDTALLQRPRHGEAATGHRRGKKMHDKRTTEAERD